MNKSTMTALVLLASASLFTASAADKNKGKKAAQQAVVLSTSGDSLSYAVGMNATRGLIPFVQQSYQVDTAYMDQFVKGFEEALSQGNAPQGVAHAAGVLIAKMVKDRVLPGTQAEFKSSKDSINADLFLKGFTAALANDHHVFTPNKAEDYKTDALMGEGKRWLAENAKKPGVKVLPSGLQYKVITEGHGEVPKASDEVEVIYEGRLLDGTVFDATAKHHGAKTDKFNAGRLIKGWTEALTMMPVGSKWEIYIPQELGYGQRQAGQIKPYSTLIFTVELKSIEKPVETKPATEANSNKNAETAKKAKAAIAKRKIMKKK